MSHPMWLCSAQPQMISRVLDGFSAFRFHQISVSKARFFEMAEDGADAAEEVKLPRVSSVEAPEPPDVT